MIRKEVLSNGLTLIVKEMRSAPVVALNLWVGVGARDDPPLLGGVSHFLEHMLLRDSGGGPPKIARVVQSAGGYLNAGTGCDHTKFYQVVPSGHWLDVLGAQVEAAGDLSVTLDDVDSERRVILEEARMAEREPASFAWRRLMESALGNTPYGRPITGTEETLARIGADQLADHHALHYTPDRMVQVIVGDVETDEVICQAGPLLERLRQGGGTPARGEPVVDGWDAAAAVFPGAASDPYVLAAMRTPAAAHEDVPVMDVLAGLLGLGRSSRLRKALVTSTPLAAEAGAGVVAYRELGLVVVSARGVPGADAEDLVAGMFDQIRGLRELPVGDREMAKSRQRVETGYVLSHETAETVAGTLGFFEMVGDFSYAEDYVDRLADVTPERLLDAAGTYMAPEDAAVVVLVPDEEAGTPSAADVRSATRRPGPMLAELHSVPGTGSWGKPGGFTRPNVIMERRTAGAVRRTLPCGARVVVCEVTGLPVVSVAMGFSGGVVEEPARKSGMTGSMLRYLLRGTAGRSANRLADDFELLGSGIATSVDRDAFGLGTSVVSRHFHEALDLLWEVATEPAFKSDDLDAVRTQGLAEIGEAEDNPFRRTMRRLLPVTFPDHAYGRPVSGTADSLAGTSLADLKRWHEGLISADRLCVCVAGDVSGDAAFAAVEQMASRTVGSARTRDGLTPTGRARGRVEEEGREPGQSSVAVGYSGPPAGTRDSASLKLAGRALTMMGGRLWRALRERPPHAYAVRAAPVSLARGGAFVAYVTAPPGGEESAVDTLRSELGRLGSEGVPSADLTRARVSLAGALRISLERSAVRAASYVLAEAMGVGHERVDRLPDIIESITNDDIIEAAGRYIAAEDGPAVVVLRG